MYELYPKNEGEMSLRLINILMFQLKMKQHEAVAEQYSRFYAFMKFIAKEDYEYLPRNISEKGTASTLTEVELE